MEGVHSGYTKKPSPPWVLQLTKTPDSSEQNSSKLRQTVCNFFKIIRQFKVLTAQCLYKSFISKGLKKEMPHMASSLSAVV